MNVSHNVVVVKDKKKKKEGYLTLRTIRNRKPKDTSLGIKIQVSNFNKEKQKVYAKEPNHKEINEKIQEVLLQAKGGKTKNFLTNKESFIQYAEKIISIVNNPNTKKGKTDALSKIKEYLETLDKHDLSFSEIDRFFVQDYYNYLTDTLAQSTANEYLTIFKYFINQVEENQIYFYHVNPFQGIKRKKGKKRYKVLTDEEVNAFFSYKSKHKFRTEVQHAFGFMMFASGMRVSDLLRLKWSNFEKSNNKYYLKYTYKKTRNLHESRLTIEAMRYLRPFIETYDDISLGLYDKIHEGYETLKETLQKAQEEYDKIQPKSYNDLFYDDIHVSNFHELNERIDIEKKKENKKRAIGDKIKAMEKAIPKSEQDMLDAFGMVLMNLKDNYGEEFVFPRMREVAQEDVHRRTHSMSGNLNHQLEYIQKELGIKTKISNHQARHVFAQRLFIAGANFHYISMALGHSSLELTENYREQLVTDEAKDVSQVFSDTFKSP